MVIVDVSKFKSEALKVNNRLGAIFKSSLDPILRELGTAEKVSCDPPKAARLQEAIFFVPRDKQILYAGALAVLRLAGFGIGARPCQLTMKYDEFGQNEFRYMGKDGKSKTLKPGSIHNKFKFGFKSSNGDMQSLKDVWVRESISFRTPPLSPTFTAAMGSGAAFTMGEGKDNHFGGSADDHMVKPLRLVCCWPRSQGECVAEQWYQFSHDFVPGGRGVWHNIPQAAFLITKGVRQSRGEWVYCLRKSNWMPHNPNRFLWEAEFPIGPPLSEDEMPSGTERMSLGSFKKAILSDFGRIIHAG